MAEMSPRELTLAGPLGARPPGPGLAYGLLGWLPDGLDVFGPVGALDALLDVERGGRVMPERWPVWGSLFAGGGSCRLVRYANTCYRSDALVVMVLCLL